MGWDPENPGYSDRRDHPEAYFSPTEGYVVRALRRQPHLKPPLVRVRDQHVVAEPPLDAERLWLRKVPTAEAWNKWGRIATELRDQIKSGELPAGSRMRSESQLCEHYEVARQTVRSALAQLELEGLVVVVPGQGRMVTTS